MRPARFFLVLVLVGSFSGLWPVGLQGKSVAKPSGARAASQAIMLDRVWARVGDAEVTRWDVTVAQALGLVEEASWRGNPVQQLVDRVLLLQEARKFQITPEGIPDLAVRAFLDQRVQSMGSQVFQEVLRRLDLDPSSLETQVRKYLAEQRFLELRVRSLILILPQDLQKAYEQQKHRFPEKSLREVEATLRRELEEAAYRRRLQEYLGDLRRRTPIQWVLPPDAPLPELEFQPGGKVQKGAYWTITPAYPTT